MSQPNNPANGESMKYEYKSGLLLRDYFAGIALAELMRIRVNCLPRPTDDDLAKEAYAVATAMLNQRGDE